MVKNLHRLPEQCHECIEGNLLYNYSQSGFGLCSPFRTFGAQWPRRAVPESENYMRSQANDTTISRIAGTMGYFCSGSLLDASSQPLNKMTGILLTTSHTLLHTSSPANSSSSSSSSSAPVNLSSLPFELLSLILSHLWFLPISSLATQERIKLMTSLPLVCKSFLDAFFLISSRDVFIPTDAYAQYFLRAVVQGSGLPVDGHGHHSGKTSKSHLPDETCHSITFILDRSIQQTIPARNGRRRKSMSETLSTTLSLLSSLSPYTVPNLRLLGIEIVDLSCDDLLEEYRLLDIPEQIQHICLDYVFVPGKMAKWAIQELRRGRKRRMYYASTRNVSDNATDSAELTQEGDVPLASWTLPSISRISIRGMGGHGNMTIARDLMSICTSAEEVMVGVSRDDLVQISSPVSTTVLSSSSLRFASTAGEGEARKLKRFVMDLEDAEEGEMLTATEAEIDDVDVVGDSSTRDKIGLKLSSGLRLSSSCFNPVLNPSITLLSTNLLSTNLINVPLISND